MRMLYLGKGKRVMSPIAEDGERETDIQMLTST